MSDGESADSADSEGRRTIADYGGDEYSARGVDAHIGLSTEAGDGANPRTGEYGVRADEHIREHDPDTPAQTHIGSPTGRETKKQARLKETNDTRDRLIDDKPMSEVEKERVVHGFAGQFGLTPSQREDAVGVMMDFDFSRASNYTLEQVALAAIQAIVNYDRFERLGVDPNRDAAWISRSEEFVAAMEGADMSARDLNKLSSKIQRECSFTFTSGTADIVRESREDQDG